ncbi:MAG TPA: hypothetical protein DF383_04225, partial [Deltaproteobacteria bacterium]|nr:hypothetical protein [Deltaproteobacteria bacterium]
MEEAFHRGEKIKNQLVHDLLNSETVGELMQNEYFLKSLSALMNTRYELKKAFRSNIKSVLRIFDLPSRDEIHSMERKLSRLETEIAGIHHKVMETRHPKAKAGARRGGARSKAE